MGDQLRFLTPIDAGAKSAENLAQLGRSSPRCLAHEGTRRYGLASCTRPQARGIEIFSAGRACSAAVHAARCARAFDDSLRGGALESSCAAHRQLNGEPCRARVHRDATPARTERLGEVTLTDRA